MTDHRHDDEIEAVLLAFAVEPEHNRATLDRYLREYPDLAEELIDLSLDLRLQRVTSDTSVPDDEAWVEQSLAAFRAKSPIIAQAIAFDPFAAASSEALVAARRALNVPSGVIEGFRSRLVDITSVPAWFVDALARGINANVHEFRNFMAGPPRLSSGLSYRSDQAPSAETSKITFEALLKQCMVPDDHRQRLLAPRE